LTKPINTAGHRSWRPRSARLEIHNRFTTSCIQQATNHTYTSSCSICSK